MTGNTELRCTKFLHYQDSTMKMYCFPCLQVTSPSPYLIFVHSNVTTQKLIIFLQWPRILHVTSKHFSEWSRNTGLMTDLQQCVIFLCLLAVDYPQTFTDRRLFINSILGKPLFSKNPLKHIIKDNNTDCLSDRDFSTCNIKLSTFYLTIETRSWIF